MNYWFSFFICIVFFFACEIEQTDNDVYGCCHSDAWNYDSDVTVHVDSVCIYDFMFINPTEESVWFEGVMETISWTGGDSNLDIRRIGDYSMEMCQLAENNYPCHQDCDKCHNWVEQLYHPAKYKTKF